ncbi:MAG TPA: LuxR C-terminal-related transcriptional regulator [Anaerolineae bacterium]|nr:LuxR C-terminal-related transcriptional regulator [Anaerolineae bacterium]
MAAAPVSNSGTDAVTLRPPLLTTKLYPPSSRPGLVPRSRLLARLNEDLSRKLTLISAPAGFGKTTLLAQWIPHSDRCVCWFSLDEADNDLARFLTYFVTALQMLKADFGQALLLTLQAPHPPPVESLMTVLVNEIAQTLDEFTLVLDDYHLIHLPAIHAAVAFLVNNLPPPMHLILASRADPILPLARLRARGQLTEIRAADLRFTLAEAAALLNEVMDLSLSAEDVAALETRTEGWIAGLQLAALSMQGRSDIAGFIKAFTGSHAYIVDYLVEEVLQRQPESVQTFLLQTSILKRMSGPLCDAVTGGDEGQTLLEKLQHNNLFIVPLDDKRHWYRYHHLFAEVLRQGLQRSLSAEAVADLHRRASTWYRQAELIDEAIHHALAAQAFDQAAMLVEQVAPVMIQHSEFVRLLIWLETLPEEEIQARPLLTLYYVWTLYISGQFNQAAARLQAVEALLEADEAKRTPEVHGLIAAVRARLLRDAGNLTGAIALSRQALANLPEQNTWLRARITLNLAIAHYLQGELGPASQLLPKTITTGHTAHLIGPLPAIYLKVQILRAQGSLQQALQLCQEGLALVARQKWQDFPAAGFLYVTLGDLLRERNELDAAAEYLEKGIRLGQTGGHHHILIIGHVWLAWLRQTEGNATGSQEAIQTALQLVQQHEVSRFWPLPSATCTQARLWIAQGHLTTASRWAETSGLNRADPLIPFLNEAAYLTLARLRIAEGSLEVAESLLLRLHQAAASAGRGGSLIEILMLQALTYAAQEQREKALAVLAQALSLAEPEGYVRLFGDEGAPLAQLLSQVTKTGLRPDYIGQLMAAFPDLPVTVGHFQTEDKSILNRQSKNQGLIEPLSERELEILSLIAEGLTNQEIADQTFISALTVKVHARNIYGKLGIKNRTQAVAKARALGLLN